MNTQMIDPAIYEGQPPSFGFVAILNDEKHVEIVRYDAFVAALAKPMESFTMDLLHGAVGVAGEAGELLDAIKKNWIYNKPLDRTNIVEEIGDIRFYLQVIINALDISEQEVLQKNANKLAKRYKGIVYSDGAAIARADKQDPAQA